MSTADHTNIIGKGITIRGSLSGGGDVIIEGRVEGQVSLKNHLIIEDSGVVDADIQVDVLTVSGTASGTIGATTKVSINQSAHVTGDIKAARVVIEDGAVFNGTIDMNVKLPEDI
jgi:cytoskeletal protein CcmA (bactofilin family)